MNAVRLALAALLCSVSLTWADIPSDLSAETADGEKVILHPNGRWEFVDTKKAIEAKKVADTFVENQGCPNGTQGGFLGFGRCIPPGDKDFNRGSMSGKGR